MSALLDRAIETIARARAPKEPPAPAGPLTSEEALERPPCPLCGATRSSMVLRAADTWVPGSERAFSVVRCAVCAVRYTTPRYRFELRHLAFAGEYPFYARARRARASGDASQLAREVESALAQVATRADLLGGVRPRPGRLLDIGAGDGLFLHLMRRRGWEVSGIDVEPDVVWFARELGLDVTAADAETDPLQEGPFDAVTLWGMLQLAYRPQRLLERIREVLSPGGVLAIGVSNAGGLGARVFGASWRGLGLPRHLTHFTPGTLRRLAEWAGYEVIRQHFETPRWITAGSVDDVVQLPGPIGSAVRTATHLASQPFAKTSLADTMVMFAVSR